MSFLNWMLLGGAAAFTLPLLIHLLNRSRFQQVDWGAMHLLESALQANSRRVQWQSLLLLLVRCSIPILLALALARPVLTYSRILGGGGDKSLVLLIDNSFSMDRDSAAGTSSCFDRALKYATEIVQRQTAATEYSIWTIGGTPSDVLSGTTFDRRRVLTQLKAIRSGAGAVSVQTSLAAGLKQSQRMQNANREILVISDFQSRDWSSFNESEQQTWKSRVEADSIRPRLSLMKIEPANSDVGNISIALDAMELPLIVTGQTLAIGAQVRNHGNASAEDVTVVLHVDGVELTSRRVSIPASGKTQVAFACQLDALGEHAIEISVDDSQGLSTDNRAYRIVDVREAIRVLLIDGQPTAPVLKRSTGYLSLALSPFQANESAKNYAIVHTIAANQVKPQILREHDVVIMSDIPRLENPAAEAIADFVRTGGGLLLFAGNSLDLNWYNSTWGTNSKSPLLPAMFTVDKNTSTKGDPNIQTDPVTKIQNLPINHPALREFSRPGAGDLTSVEIRRSLQIQIAAPADHLAPSQSLPAGNQPKANVAVSKINDAVSSEKTNTARAQVLLQLVIGNPLLVAQRFEKGKVLQFATTADDSWSDFPLRPAYVPLMQGLVQWLAPGIDKTHNVLAGEPLDLVLRDSRSATTKVQRSSSDPIEVTLEAPESDPVSLRLTVDGSDRFDQTAYPGIYRLRSAGAKVESLFAVNIQAAESENSTLESQQMQQFATGMNATLALTADSYFEQENLRNNGRELWRIFILSLVALLFAELWLQQHISRGAA